MDYRDAMIEDFAASENALLECIVELTIERDVWRLIAMAALHHCHELTRDRDRLRERYYGLLHQLRAGGQRSAA